MLLRRTLAALNITSQPCLYCRGTNGRWYTNSIDNKYTANEKEKILQVINGSDINTLSMYDVAKAKLKKVSQWRTSNGHATTLADIEMIEGFTVKTAKKLFDSILKGPKEQTQSVIPNRIRGQILHPNLTEAVIKACNSVLTVYISVSSVCWTLINKSNYEVLEWKYSGIEYPDGKRLQITDILDIAWRITRSLPPADIYVMKAEATTLRAAGSDPNNPKVMAVNLQKAQMISMIVALINARSHSESANAEETSGVLKHRVYFLRPSLPFRLYGTLVGQEKVATDQTVSMLLDNLSDTSDGCLKVPDRLKTMFRNQRDLQKDMLGHCLLLSLTFMDLCIYRNQERINALIKRGD